MNTKRTIIITTGIVIALAAGLAGGYFYAQSKADQNTNALKEEQKTAIEKAVADAKAKENTNNTKTDSSRPAHEKTPPKVSTDTTCNTDELTLSTETNNGGGAGTLSFNIVLTNSGTRTCTLFGYPGVSLVNANGNQIGKPADRHANTEARITLAPKASARSVLYVPNEANFPDGTCQDGATKLRVYAPNDSGYLSAATTQTSWCPGFAVEPVAANL